MGGFEERGKGKGEREEVGGEDLFLDKVRSLGSFAY
jgi:hypothetical protein